MNLRHTTKLAASALALLALPGCAAIFGGGNHMARSLETLRKAPPADFGAQQLALGREALKAGNTAEAIDAFMVARLYPEQTAAAFNGMAVAYSRLGRTDLTERFFQNAIALAPTDDRYRANLAVFYSRHGMPRSTEPVAVMALASTPVVGELPAIENAAAPVAAPIPQLAVHTPAVRQVQLGGGVTARTSSSGMTRVSAREVAVVATAASPSVTLTAAAAPRRPVEIRVGTGSPANPGMRVTMAGTPRPAAYPVRIRIGE